MIGGNAAKRRQVDAFLRALAATLGDEEMPSPLRVVDLGCGNAYLTFAAFRYLSSRGLDVRLTGVDVREDQRERNTALAGKLGWADRVDFVAGTISGAAVDGADVALALHACDTATDEALARAVGWGAGWILAAPCCHHDIAAQLKAGVAPDPYQLLTRHGILRERFADVLTDALRAALLRLHGYRVDVVEFVDSAAHAAQPAAARPPHRGGADGRAARRVRRAGQPVGRHPGASSIDRHNFGFAPRPKRCRVARNERSGAVRAASKVRSPRERSERQYPGNSGHSGVLRPLLAGSCADQRVSLGAAPPRRRRRRRGFAGSPSTTGGVASTVTSCCAAGSVRRRRRRRDLAAPGSPSVLLGALSAVPDEPPRRPRRRPRLPSTSSSRSAERPARVRSAVGSVPVISVEMSRSL